MEAATIESVIGDGEALLADGFDTSGTTVMIVWGGMSIERQFLAHQTFVPVWQEPESLFERGSYLGRLRGAPVFFIFDENESQVLFLALEQSCIMDHYVPRKDNHEGLLIRITEIDESEAKRLLDTQPDIVSAEDGSSLSSSDAVRRLQLRVRVFLGAKIELKIDDQSGLQLVPLIQN